jgi:hypothetical protein
MPCICGAVFVVVARLRAAAVLMERWPLPFADDPFPGWSVIVWVDSLVSVTKEHRHVSEGWACVADL